MKLRTFKNLSIKRKITYLYLPLAIVPMVIFALVSMSFYEKTIVNRSLVSMGDNNVLIADRLDDIFKEAESGATFLTLSINRLFNSESYKRTLGNDIRLYNLVSNELSYAKLIYENIDSIAFIDVDSRIYYSDFELQDGRDYIADSEHMKLLKSTTGNSVWFDIEKRNFLTSSKDLSMLTLGKKIWNINSGETIGYLFINISEIALTALFEGQLAHYEMIDDNGASILSSKTNIEDWDKQLRSEIEIPKHNWTLVSTANYGLLTSDLENIILLLFTLLVTIIVLEVTMSLVLNRWITNPIVKLMGGLEEIAKGNFDYRFNMKTSDEIGLFAERFNHMSSQIAQLLSAVEYEEKKKREYELALIQQQIKPHFLYNSLDIILKLSLMGQERKAQKVTRRLADYYKKSLSGGADIITLEEELALTVDYIELQKHRYSDAFDYSIELHQTIEGKRIPKLSLQPLVENAIDHGFKYQAERGHLKIYDFIGDDMYEVIVEDNGAGMALYKAEMLNFAFEHPYENDLTKSYGLRNVNHRLKLLFGTQYGLEIESVEGQGTKVVLKLPKDGLI